MADQAKKNETEYPVADLLAHLYAELDRAIRVDRDQPWSMRVVEATVEMGVTWEKKGDGGLDVKVVKLGGSVTKANEDDLKLWIGSGDGSAAYLPG